MVGIGHVELVEVWCTWGEGGANPWRREAEPLDDRSGTMPF